MTWVRLEFMIARCEHAATVWHWASTQGSEHMDSGKDLESQGRPILVEVSCHHCIDGICSSFLVSWTHYWSGVLHSMLLS